MTIIQSFWSPCWCYNDLKQGCVAVAIYTLMFSIVSIVYTAWIIVGGQSSDLYSPFFETDVRYNASHAGAGVIIFCCLFIISAGLLILGALTNNRAIMYPWLFLMSFLILFSLAFGIFLIARYYVDVRSVLSAIFIWTFTGFNIYCFLCVYSQIRVLKTYQTRHIIKLRA